MSWHASTSVGPRPPSHRALHGVAAFDQLSTTTCAGDGRPYALRGEHREA